MPEDIIKDSGSRRDSENRGKKVRLSAWDEARGRLKEVDRDNNEVVLEVRREFRVKLPLEKLKEMENLIGAEVSVLKPDESVDDDFLVNVEGEGKDG